MVRADRILGMILLFLSLVCFIEGIRVWDGMGGTGFMPALLGAVFALLGPGLLIPRSPSQASVSISWPLKAGWQQIGLIFFSMALYTFLLPWVGFLLGTALFLTVLIRVMGRVHWGYSLIFGCVVSVITYVVFKIWLNMSFPAGFLGV
jgi:hypothetical protein